MTVLSTHANGAHTNPHLTLLQERLTALKASELTIHDESHLHAGHADNHGDGSLRHDGVVGKN